MAAIMEASLTSEMSSSHSTHPFYDHPKIHEMRSYGFGNEEQIKQALLVYLDLLEAKRWWSVRVVPCSGLCQVLVVGQSAQREPLEVILPVRQDNELSVCDLQNLLTKVKAEHECTSLTLALMDSESTIVYYKISDGFIPPDPPESIQEKKRQRQRKFQHRKARFVQLSRQQEHARARQFAAGSQITNPPPGGSTLGNDQKEAAASTKGVDPMTGVVSEPSPEEQIQQPGPSKRPLDPSPHDTQEGSKHRKVECQSSSSSSNISGPCPVPNPAAMAFCEPQHSPAYGMAPQNAENSPPQGLFNNNNNNLADPAQAPQEEAAGPAHIPMVQAHVAENDSDHDSGMDAGEDDEDEGFDEEL